MQKRWLIKSAQNSTTVEDFRSEIKTDSIVAELLLQRGIDSVERARDFFNPSLEQLHDPFALLNMDKAVSLLDQSIENQSRILLYGDYDVDGTTAVSLLYNFLKEYTDRIDYISKYDFYGELAQKAIDIVKETDDKCSNRELLFEVLRTSKIYI